MRRRLLVVSILPAALIALLLEGCGARQNSDLYTSAPPPSSTAAMPPSVPMAGGQRGFNTKPEAFKPAGYGKKQ